MTTLIATIFAASLLGSFHCAGMCGAFVAIATGNVSSGRRVAHWRLQAAYHLGRLVTYVGLGAAAGFAGRLLDIAGALAGVRPVAAVIAGLAMAGFGLILLLQSRGWSIARMKLPPAWVAGISALHRLAIKQPPLTRACMIGLFTTLLPCGWLYAFVVCAAGLAHPAKGALAMAVFWAGTLPMLVTIGAGARFALGSLAKKLPAVTAIALIVVAVHTLVTRTLLDPAALAARAQAHNVPAVAPSVHEKPACCEVHETQR